MNGNESHTTYNCHCQLNKYLKYTRNEYVLENYIINSEIFVIHFVFIIFLSFHFVFCQLFSFVFMRTRNSCSRSALCVLRTLCVKKILRFISFSFHFRDNNNNKWNVDDDFFFAFEWCVRSAFIAFASNDEAVALGRHISFFFSFSFIFVWQFIYIFASFACVI